MPSPPLIDGQFALDGYVFGTASDPVVILAKGHERPAMDFRTQDVDLPLGDGTMFGRDQITPPTWTFTMGVRHDVSVYDVLEDLAAAWRADGVRLTPGARCELRYRRGGKTRIVYGRPRGAAVQADDINDDYFKVVVTQFRLDSINSYGDTLNSVPLSQVTSTIGTGLVLPTPLPAALVATTAARSGMVIMGSLSAAPFTVTLQGPTVGSATDVKVWTSNWLLHFGVTLTTGDVFTYDTSTGAATLNGARASAGLKGASTARARMSTGSNEVVMTSSDTSNTLTGAIQWRDVFASF